MREEKREGRTLVDLDAGPEVLAEADHAALPAVERGVDELRDLD